MGLSLEHACSSDSRKVCRPGLWVTRLDEAQGECRPLRSALVIWENSYRDVFQAED